MDALILQVGGKSGRVRELVRSYGEAVGIGRGFGNLVVLTDPYVAPEQGSFQFEDGQWFFVNNDDTNRVLLNGEGLSAQKVGLHPGDCLMLGRTEIRIYSPDHEVAPTRKLLLSDWIHHDSIGLLAPLLALAILNLLDFSVDYLLDTTRETEWKEYVINLLWMNLFLLGWSGIWAINGRLLRHHYHFGQQLFITTVWLIGVVLVFPILSYIDFAIDGGMPSTLIAMLTLMVMVAWLVKFNLYFSTSGRHATGIGIAVSIVLVGGLSIVNFLSKEDFETRAEANSELFPGFTLPGSGESVDSYFAEVEAIVGAADQDQSDRGGEVD